MPNTLAGVEQFVSLGTAAVTAGGNTTPAAGTSESWTLAGSTLPAASNAATPPTGFYIADPAVPSEVMLVTNISGATATVTRGADGTTPAAHTPTFTINQVAAGATFNNVGLRLQASTTVAGYTLVNGTGTVITWTAPNDGLLHTVMVAASLHVATNEVGGTIQVAWTEPGGVTNAVTLAASGQVANNDATNPVTIVVKANTAVNVNQSSALTGGAATLWAQIWGV